MSFDSVLCTVFCFVFPGVFEMAVTLKFITIQAQITSEIRDDR